MVSGALSAADKGTFDLRFWDDAITAQAGKRCSDCRHRLL